jgi:hypothetical protein
MLTIQHCQELLSRAHIQALAARARLNIEFRSNSELEFDYGVDGSFRPIEILGGMRYDSGCPLDFQLMSSVNWKVRDGQIVYDIEAKAYNKLVSRSPRATPYILILLCLPPNIAEAVILHEAQMLMKHCCYWMRLAGPVTTNSEKIRIVIPTGNRLTPETLVDLLSRVRRGETL